MPWSSFTRVDEAAGGGRCMIFAPRPPEPPEGGLSVTLTAEPRDYHRRLPLTVCRGRDDSAVCREFLRTDRSRSLDEHTGHGEGCRAKVRRYGHAIRSPRFGNYTYRAGSDENEAVPEQENRAAAQHQARLARSACGCCAQGPVVPGAGIALRHAGSSCGRAMVPGRGWQTLGKVCAPSFGLRLNMLGASRYVLGTDRHKGGERRPLRCSARPGGPVLRSASG